MDVIPGANLGAPAAPAGLGWGNARLLGTVEIGNLLYAFETLDAWDAHANRAVVQLFARMCVNGVWAAWTPLGAPPPGIDFLGSYQGTVVSVGSDIYVFVLGADGQLWCDYWNVGIGRWQWIAIGQPKDASGKAMRIALVDGANAAPLAVTVSVDGAPWGAFYNPAGWMWAKLPAAAPFQRRTNSVLAVYPASDFYVNFQTDEQNNLVCGAHALAAVATTGPVLITADGCTLPPAVGVRGLNVDGTSASLAAFVMTGQNSVTLDLRQGGGFKDGAICWAFCVDGSDDSLSVVMTNAAVLGAMMNPIALTNVAAALSLLSIPSQKVSGRESQARFNFTPRMGGRGAAYMLSEKTVFPIPGVPAWYSWSNVSATMG
jgi:hypothetical protein